MKIQVVINSRRYEGSECYLATRCVHEILHEIISGDFDVIGSELKGCVSSVSVMCTNWAIYSELVQRLEVVTFGFWILICSFLKSTVPYSST